MFPENGETETMGQKQREAILVITLPLNIIHRARLFSNNINKTGMSLGAIPVLALTRPQHV